MLFWLKKAISFGMMPLSVCAALLAAGLVMLRSSRRRRTGWGMALAGLAGMILLSNHFVARALLRPLETRYAGVSEFKPGKAIPEALAQSRFIVVLSAGYGHTDNTAAIHTLTSSALARIAEGVRLARMLPAAKLIVSGPRIVDGVTHATQLANTAISLGLEESRIIRVDEAVDTEDEARLIAVLVGSQPVALVTSALHMPRAMTLFKARGVNAFPCPTGFRTQAGELFTIEQCFFDVESLGQSTAAVHEYIGIVWARLREKRSS